MISQKIIHNDDGGWVKCRKVNSHMSFYWMCVDVDKDHQESVNLIKIYLPSTPSCVFILKSRAKLLKVVNRLQLTVRRRLKYYRHVKMSEIQFLWLSRDIFSSMYSHWNWNDLIGVMNRILWQQNDLHLSCTLTFIHV